MRTWLEKRRLLIIPIVVAMVVGSTAFYAAMKLSRNQGGVEASACESSACVSLNTDGADPETLSVPVGSFVEFNSADGKSHNLSLGKGGEEHDHSGPFHSGEFQADEGWRVQFKDKGTFFFHDHYNPSISILVVVYEPGGDHSIE